MLTGSHRFILDYLVEEVLKQQPEEIKTFLLRTSVLKRMCAELCGAVIENRQEESLQLSAGGLPEVGSRISFSSSQSILDHLETPNLFPIPLDTERTWYRNHTLFADLLRYRLEQEQPEQIPGLHRRAAGWLQSISALPQTAYRSKVSSFSLPWTRANWTWSETGSVRIRSRREHRSTISMSWKLLVLLDRVLQVVRAGGQVARELPAMIEKSLVQWMLGRKEEALQTFQEALQTGEACGYVRPFLTPGNGVKELLLELAAREASSPYQKSLLACFAEQPGPAPAFNHTPVQAGIAKADVLSEREIEVLRLVALGLSNGQIAERLVLSENTVKRHLHNIFSKLDATSRAQAIHGARELGLV